MRARSTESINNTVIEFIDCTGNLALAIGVCAVCAREISLTELTLIRLDAFPNSHRLRPEVAHPAHDIFNGMLLHPKGVKGNGEANTCVECAKALELDRIPKFAAMDWQSPTQIGISDASRTATDCKVFPSCLHYKALS